jgi:hypothetical protein
VLKNNWSYGATLGMGDLFGLLGSVGIYSNGRTYALISNSNTGLGDFYDLTNVGLRYTGKPRS